MHISCFDVYASLFWMYRLHPGIFFTIGCSGGRRWGIWGGSIRAEKTIEGLKTRIDCVPIFARVFLAVSPCFTLLVCAGSGWLSLTVHALLRQ